MRLYSIVNYTYRLLHRNNCKVVIGKQNSNYHIRKKLHIFWKGNSMIENKIRLHCETNTVLFHLSVCILA